MNGSWITLTCLKGRITKFTCDTTKSNNRQWKMILKEQHSQENLLSHVNFFVDSSSKYIMRDFPVKLALSNWK